VGLLAVEETRIMQTIIPVLTTASLIAICYAAPLLGLFSGV
jgi:hypothetical protein